MCWCVKGCGVKSRLKQENQCLLRDFASDALSTKLAFQKHLCPITDIDFRRHSSFVHIKIFGSRSCGHCLDWVDRFLDAVGCHFDSRFGYLLDRSYKWLLLLLPESNPSLLCEPHSDIASSDVTVWWWSLCKWYTEKALLKLNSDSKSLLRELADRHTGWESFFWTGTRIQIQEITRNKNNTQC